MKRKSIVIFGIFSLLFISAISAGNKKTGERCIGDAECEYGTSCTNGVCIKKPEFNYGGSEKTGKACQIDADCIGAGKCVQGNYGKKYCSG